MEMSTQKKIEEFVEEELKPTQECAMTYSGFHGHMEKALRRAIAYGLRLSCEMGPEKARAKRIAGRLLDATDIHERGWNSALSARDKACLEEAERVEKG